jgi:hypothetical protein
VRITKVVLFFTINPTELVLHFSEFSTIFYTFYNFLQKCNTIEDELLRRGPCTESGPRNWVPRPWEAAALAEFRRAGRTPGRGGGGARSPAHLVRGGERGSSGDSSGGGARRRPAVAPAAGCGSGRERAMSSNGWRHKLLWLLGSGLEGLGALEKGRGGELADGRQWRARRRAVAARGRAWLGLYRRNPLRWHCDDDARCLRSTVASVGARTAGCRRRTAGPRRAPGRYGAARRVRPREDSEEPRGAVHGEVRTSGGGDLGRRVVRMPRVGRRASVACDATASRAAAPWLKCFAGALFERIFLQKFEYKLTKRWIRKL